MLKDIIGRIIDAESTAERIEAESLERADAIRSSAIIEAECLKNEPSKAIKEQADALIRDAEIKAEKLARDKLEQNKQSIINDSIDKAVQITVNKFLARV